LIAFEQDRHSQTGQRVLTCILLPQTDSNMNRYVSSKSMKNNVFDLIFSFSRFE